MWAHFTHMQPEVGGEIWVPLAEQLPVPKQLQERGSRAFVQATSFAGGVSLGSAQGLSPTSPPPSYPSPPPRRAGRGLQLSFDADRDLR